jgi:uncharacterized protein
VTRLAIGLLVLGVLALVFVAVVPKRDEPLAHWWIKDEAHLLKPAEELRLTRYHGELLDTWDIDYRIRTVTDVYDLDALAVDSFEDLGVGDRSRAGRGLLLVIDPGRQRVRLEVARELEGTYPDAFVAYVEREQMAPFFAAGRVADGILAMTELLVGQAADPSHGLTETAAPRRATSVGAGAMVPAPIDTGYARPDSPVTVRPVAGATPGSTVAAYLASMAAGDARPDLDLYTRDTHAFLSGQVVTLAQMDNVARTYSRCGDGETSIRDTHAVLRYPNGNSACAPWLLVRSEDGRWRLDLVTMSRALRFDTANRWRLADPQSAREYAFGLETGG